VATQTQVTVDDVLRLADQGKNFELVDGVLVEMSPTSVIHGELESLISHVFRNHVDARQLGLVVAGDMLFRLDVAGRLARAAGVAFIAADRLPGEQTPLGGFIGAPDLAVEIISPSNTANAIQEKVGHWLSHGTKGVLLVYSSQRSVVLWTAGGAVHLNEDEELDLDPLIPGFRCKVSQLFPRRSPEKASKPKETVG
jgi:Uma2 family endonuclease